jgi:hypothetical protein
VWLRRLLDVLALPGAVYLLALPVCLLLWVINPRSALGVRDLGGWSWPIYSVFLLQGFTLVSHDHLQQRIVQLRAVSLSVGLVLFPITAAMVFPSELPFGTLQAAMLCGLYGLNSWCWMLAILGFAMHYLTDSPAWLSDANEAVLPFYALHQTVILAIGFVVVRWAIPDALKFVIISASSFITIIAFITLLIWRSNVLRVLFGMKTGKRTVTAEQQTTHPSVARTY